MPRVSQAIDRTDDRAEAARLDAGNVVAFALPVVFVVYLALKNGGYDPIPTGEAGLAIWWVLLVATLVGALPSARLRSAAGLVAVLLTGLAVWTALALTWTESAERTMFELARTVTYLGFFLFGAAVVGRGHGRALVGGVAAAVGLIVALAALSRLEPNWFPEQNVGEFLPDVELESRLAYPINYSSGLAALCGIGVPLFLAAAASARTLPTRLLGAAALPTTALTLWLTGSSLGIPVLAVAIGAYLLLTHERIPALVSLAIGGAAGAVLIFGANSREALDRGLDTPAALAEGDSLLVILLVVTAAAVAGQALAELVFRRRPELRGPLVPASATRAIVVAGIVVVVLAGVAAGVPGKLADRVDDFTSAEGLDPDEGARGEQVLDVSARGRVQYWQAALDVYSTEPLLGIGPGTFEFYWAREGDPDAAIFVRDAHSLYLEALAELGPLGLLFVLGLAALVLVGGVRRARRASPEARPTFAAATAGCAVFVAVAAVDWVWELAALGVVFFLLAAASTGDELGPEGAGSEGRRMRAAAPVAVLSVLALVAIAIPFAGTTLVDRSRESAAQGRLDDALEQAHDAVAVQPNAATPRIQEATVLESLGDLDGAVKAAGEATERESTNWRMWIVLSRLEARNGDADAAVSAYERGQALFPRVDLAPE